MLHIVGDCDERIFGLRPAERLRRQIRRRGDVEVVAHASAVLDDAALDWLIQNRGTMIVSATHRRLAIAVDSGEVAAAKAGIAGASTDFPVAVPSGQQFVRKLRRRVELGVHSLIDEPARTVEKRLFANAYKGVTDVVTRWVWPWPAFQVTRAAALTGITPNMITFAGLALVFAAGWLFYRGDLGAALAAAWLMTFFDTVDGKLARVTSTSSRFGDILDHGTDIIHPPIWWYCLAHGLALMVPDDSSRIWSGFWIILVCYVAGRAVELAFHRIFGFNQYIWQPFDSHFRLVVSRRNTILLIMTVGLILDRAGEAFLAAAGWTLLSLLIQLVRLGGARRASRGGPLTSWLN